MSLTEKDIQKNDELNCEYEEPVRIPPIEDFGEESKPFYGLCGQLTYWGFSQQGKSHIKKDTPCQDRCKVVVSESEMPIIIAAISDGVGSCVLSHYGASIVTESATSYLKEKFDNHDEDIDDKWVGDSLREAMKYAQECVAKAAEEMEQLEYSFQSTLTIAIYDGNTLYMGHVGDDGIVALTDDGRVELVTSRIKGEEASSVYPLQAGPAYWQVMKVGRNVNGFVMATDGVLDAFVRGESEKNRIYYPFIQPAIETCQNSEDRVKETMEFYYNYMSGEEYRKTVTDDVTLLVVTNQKLLNKENIPVFDADVWKKKTKEYEEKILAALYPDRDDVNSIIPVQEKPDTRVQENKQKIVCIKCGTILKESYKYCPNCGTNTRQSPLNKPSDENAHREIKVPNISQNVSPKQAVGMEASDNSSVSSAKETENSHVEEASFNKKKDLSRLKKKKMRWRRTEKMIVLLLLLLLIIGGIAMGVLLKFLL